MPANRAHAEKVRAELAKLAYLRDLHAVQPFDYPTLEVAVDRERAGQFGLTAIGCGAISGRSHVVQSLRGSELLARSGERQRVPDPGRNPAKSHGLEDDVRNVPVMPDGGSRPLLGDVADVKLGHTAGEIDRYNMQRVVSFTANVHGEPLGEAAAGIRAAIARAGNLRAE